MSCYFRHPGDVFTAAGIEVTKKNRNDVNVAVVEAMGKELPHCPEVWQEVKAALATDEAAFIRRLREVWQTHAAA